MAYLGQPVENDIQINRYEYEVGTPTDLYDGSLHTFPCVYSGSVEVSIQGIELSKTDYIATSGVDITLFVDAVVGQIVQIKGFYKVLDNNAETQTFDPIATGLISTTTHNAIVEVKTEAESALNVVAQSSRSTSARNTVLSTVAAGLLAQAVTPTASFATNIYTGNGTSQSIVTGLKSYDPNWVSGRAYSLLNEQDAYCIHNYYIYKLLADVTSATTPDLDPTNWEVVADGESVAWFNSHIEIKKRNGTDTTPRSHVNSSTLQGIQQFLHTDLTNAEANGGGATIDSVDSSGFILNSSNDLVNGLNSTYVAWQEQFDTMVSGTTNQGKRYITASNAQSGKGMSIYVGSGTAGHEIPHGLGTAIDIVHGKNRDTVSGWISNTSVLDPDYSLQLDTNGASFSGREGVDYTLRSGSILMAGTSQINNLNNNCVAYFSSNRDNHTITKRYQGTGAAGNVVPLGLDMTQAGAKVMIKPLSTTGDWIIHDNIRSLDMDALLYANTSGAEAAAERIDPTTTGITITVGADAAYNGAGVTYLIEATVPNYDKPNGGLNRPAGNILSFAEGVDGTTGDLDSIETTTSVDFSLTTGAKNYLFADKGNTVLASTVKRLKGLDRVSADKWGVVSPSDVTLKTTAKHSNYASATGVVSASTELASYPAYNALDKTVYPIGTGNKDWYTDGAITGSYVYKTFEPRALQTIRFRTGCANGTDSVNKGRVPKDFTIEGSNDGVSWSVLATITGNVPAETNNFGSSVSINSAIGYFYHRITITANNGDATISGFGELELNTEHPAGDFYDVAEGTSYSLVEVGTNGTFDTDTDWVKGTGWTISGGKANSNGTSSDIYQVNVIGSTSYDDYIEVEVSLTSGSLQVFGGYSTLIKTITASGTYRFSTSDKSNGTLRFTSISFLGSIDNVSIKTLIPSSRIPLGEVVVDSGGEAILDTLIVYPKINDVVDLEVHRDAKFYGGFDLGQSWVDEISDRLTYVPYKNETGKPKQVAVTTTTTTTTKTLSAYVDGQYIISDSDGSTGNHNANIYFEVPVGSIYLVASNHALATWKEK